MNSLTKASKKTIGWFVLIWLSLMLNILPARAAKLCVVRGFNFKIYDQVAESFKKGLPGWDFSCDLTLKGKKDEAKKIIEENQPDGVLVLGNSALIFVKKNFPDIPIIFGMASNVQGGAKQAGVTVEIPYGQQIQLTKQALNGLKRIGIIYSAKNSNKAQRFIAAAKEQGLTVNSHAVSSPQDVLKIVPKLENEDLFWILLDEGVVTVRNRNKILKSARQINLKTYAFSPIYLKGSHGADLSVSISWDSYGRQLASLAKRLLANPNQNFPIEAPRDVKIYLKKGRPGFNANLANVVIIP